MKHNKASFVVAMKSIAKLYLPFRWVLLATFVFIVLNEVVVLLTPYYVGRIVDKDIALTGEAYKFVFLILCAETASLIFSYLHYTNDICNLEFQSRKHLVRHTLEKLFGFSVGQVTHEHSGYLQSIISKGEAAISTIVKTFIQELLPTIIKITVTVGAIFYFSVGVGSVALLTTLSFTGISLMVNLKMRHQTRQHQIMESRNQQWYSDVVRNLKLILLNSQQGNILKEQERRYGESVSFGKSLWLKYNTVVCGTREPLNKIMFAVMIAVSVYQYQLGLLKLGEVVMLASWIVILLRHFEKIGAIQRRYINEYPSVYRYFEVLSTPPKIVQAENPTRPKKIHGKVEFRNVSFAYPREENEEEGGATIKDVSLSFDPGKTYAIVGQSGAGKSTLISLLQRAYDPQAGEILVDGIDLRLMDLHFYRRNIGYVEQEIKLWDDTIRYNILFGLNGEAKYITDEDLERVAEQTCITEFYNRLGPKKFDTLIGENGIQLSGGQRQRVGIARALIKNPQILIFDEATNSLDNISDALIQKAMRQALQGRTGIIIAHRLSTVRHADQIVVMSHGRVVGIGTHYELMNSCQDYINLVEKEAVAIV